MDPKKEKMVIPVDKKPSRNPAAKELENFPAVTHKDRRKPRGGAKNITRDYTDDEYGDFDY